MDWWAWIRAHPAEAAWMAFGLLVLLVAAYKPVEPRLRAWAGRTPSRTDDKLVAGLSHAVALLTILLDVAQQLAPHLLSRWAAGEDRAR